VSVDEIGGFNGVGDLIVSSYNAEVDIDTLCGFEKLRRFVFFDFDLSWRYKILAPTAAVGALRRERGGLLDVVGIISLITYGLYNGLLFIAIFNN
jgi:hypothetical protein